MIVTVDNIYGKSSEVNIYFFTSFWLSPGVMSFRSHPSWVLLKCWDLSHVLMEIMEIMIKEGRGSGSYLKISWYDTSVLVAIKGMKSDVYGQKLNYEL